MIGVQLMPQVHPLVELIYFDAGGGHRASANALAAVAERQRRRWRIRMTNLRDVLEPADFIRRLTGVRAEDFYNAMLKFDLTAGVGPMLPIMHALIRRTHTQNAELLARHWVTERPDLVVSLIPHFNRSILDGLRAADAHCDGLATPMIVVMTDLADTPPHFWIELQDQFVICGTPRAAQQAMLTGLAPRRIIQTSGMIVRHEFYEPLKRSRTYERQLTGLDPDLPTGLVMFGGYGSRRMITIAQRLAELPDKFQLVFICGHNQLLRDRLLAMKLKFPHHVEGFTRNVSYFMRLADFFIGKPGPGSLSEALVSGLPVIVERNSSTMIQERYNTEWIAENRLGIVIRSFSEIGKAVSMMIDDKLFPEFRARVTQNRNDAVFEIPEILDQIMTMPRENLAGGRFMRPVENAKLYG